MAMIAVGPSASKLTEVIDPSSFSWGLQDVSAIDAGRSQDINTTMWKNRMSQKRTIQLTWQNITFKEASQIVQLFNDEYMYVRFPDLLDGGDRTSECYVGDRTAPFLWYQLPGIQGTRMTLSFDVIER